MKRISYKISAGAILFFAAAYFFDDAGVVAAALPAVFVHELGHILALQAFGARINRVSVGVFGLEIDYAGFVSAPKTALALFAGPLFGGLYALTAVYIKNRFLMMSCSISLMLTVFNLLPVMPLDGGRLVACALAPEMARRLSMVCAVILALGGAISFVVFGSASLLIISAWIFVYNYSMAKI